MTNQIFTATGCARCGIVKRYMSDQSIDYQEHDIKAEGKQIFSQFYRANRKDIFRSKDGVEFPVFFDGKAIRQGVGPVIGYLMAEKGLDGFVSIGSLHGEWMDGIDISGGDSKYAEDLLKLLTLLKSNGLKLQITTEGHNADVLKSIVEKGLCDRAIMAVRGPWQLYDALTGKSIDKDDFRQSIQYVCQCPEYQLFTKISAFDSEQGMRYLVPEEIAQTAQQIEEATGSKKHPYEIQRIDPASVKDLDQSLDPVPDAALFKYRTAARRYMVMTEIKK